MKVTVLVLGLLAVLLAACSPPPPLRDENLLSDDTLLTDVPCTAPCWKGITPGVTTWNDAVTILEDDSALANVQVQQDDNSTARVAEFQGAGGAACCQMFSQDGEIVSLLFLRLAPDLTVADLIDAKGEPTYVIGSEFAEDQAFINLLYPELNTVVYAFVAGKTGAISEDSELIGVLYTQPSDMELLLTTQFLHLWDGYAPYLDYAPAPDNATDFEVTPSVTETPTPDGG